MHLVTDHRSVNAPPYLRVHVVTTQYDERSTQTEKTIFIQKTNISN
jgi:hypothetical protein